MKKRQPVTTSVVDEDVDQADRPLRLRNRLADRRDICHVAGDREAGDLVRDRAGARHVDVGDHTSALGCEPAGCGRADAGRATRHECNATMQPHASTFCRHRFTYTTCSTGRRIAGLKLSPV